MQEKMQKELFKKYPKIFKMIESTPQESCMAWGLEVGDGWYWLIDKLCYQIQRDIDLNNDHHQIIATQVKEKFGGLRFYIESGSDEQYSFIDFAETLSYFICEECGSTEEVFQNKTGWIKTTCKKCKEKENVGK